MPDTRVALVTGASRGIGRETALAFARAGFDVAVTARTVREGRGTVPPRTRRDGDEPIAVPGSLETTAAAIESLGVRALPVPMDLLDVDSVRAAGRRVLDVWGRIDVLVNNAYAQTSGNMDRLLDIDLADAAAMVEGNYLHQLALIQTVLPAMLARGGGVVIDLVSGSAAIDPPAPPGEGGWGLSYAASKAAFARVAGMINAEYRARGVRAFNLSPGFVVTESGRARGGTRAVEDAGFDAVPATVPADAAVWLATVPDADRLLGKVVWAPTLIERMSASAVERRNERTDVT
ncbi:MULTISPECIES: SDR family NAD(P)-dependent oxidoreductase [Rhodococcus]|uniref:3-oxoacyl-[acyl-carrier protein] reductase n=1 Tax=Rhodococcus aetherivorans TaxID=191292 RepID=N1M6N2_9NOCA|nr:MULTISPECIES: SDR family oxidoreductase [Rhodococcus]ETT27241.1 short-chain dehydrogenase/reductase SDR [Rhodococcus rhodochrous ATCC 21198]AKE91461.1 oxidoreductase [Rhodococcus aetherivorans]NGP28607.1 SDR family oxidoreductase [Rhodococcus aetherivorans]QRI77710.1 SDR family oxidoreductase [Rhodococcus aetherivorans]QSE61127.1 SDR family oxidoreductase [Rhodococcus sp. PSBB066]